MARRRFTFVVLVLLITTVAPAQSAEDGGVPNAVTRVAPIYPPLARQARIEGTVKLSVTVDESGSVSNVAIIEGHPMLTPSAVEAVKQWKFSPLMVDQEPTETVFPLTVEFKLHKSSDKPESVFQRDYPEQMTMAQSALRDGKPSGAFELAEKAFTLARNAKHSREAARAKLIMARALEGQNKDAAAEYGAAVALIRQARIENAVGEANEVWAEIHFYAGRNHFNARRFAEAEPLLRTAVQSLRFSGERLTAERRATLARAASMLAECGMQLGHPRNVAYACRIVQGEKSFLHGLELDEANQTCR